MTEWDKTVWMWSEACAAMARADRLRQQFFGRGAGAAASQLWEPPIDVFELAGKIVVVVALPGVDAKSVEVSFERGVLSVYGHRAFPPELRHAEIRVLEIPWGRFGRRFALPGPDLHPESCTMTDGCLRIVLARA
jgi:HSP20 family molecular chaperone IbpA